MYNYILYNIKIASFNSSFKANIKNGNFNPPPKLLNYREKYIFMYISFICLCIV